MAATGPTLIHFVYVILKMTVNFVYCTAKKKVLLGKSRLQAFCQTINYWHVDHLDTQITS